MSDPTSTSPTVSVVIPTYNAPTLLLETLSTVFAQTFRDFEVIVVVDGCTDDTEAQLRRIDDPRLRIIVQPNAGIGAARNRGIDEARGEFVALLDHDDTWLPEKLAVQVDYHHRNPDVVGSMVLWEYSNNPGTLAVDPRPALDARGIVARPIRLFVGDALFVSAALMFRRSECSDLRYETQRDSIEDVGFQIQLLLRGPFGVAGERPLMIYRVVPTSASRTTMFRYNGLKLLRRRQAEGRFDTADVQQRADVDAYLASIAHGAITYLLLAGERAKAMELFRREWRALLRNGRWRFAAVVPIALVAPRRWSQQRWSPASSTGTVVRA